MLRSHAAGVAVLEDRSPISGSKISDFGGISVNPGYRFVIWKLGFKFRSGCSIRVSKQNRVLLLEKVVEKWAVFHALDLERRRLRIR